MCKNYYEKMCQRTGKTMLFCNLKSDETNELLKLCSYQRYCSEEDKYIPHRQKEGCKSYED